MRIRNAQQKQNAMNKEEILETVLNYVEELNADYEEIRYRDWEKIGRAHV